MNSRPVKKVSAKRKAAKRNLPARQDGLETRQQLLQAAGEVFGEHGYANATSKEICERANANVAAVNYHFGGKDGLYAAVLEEAHARLISLDALAAAAHSPIDPRLKLKMFIGRIVGEISKRGAESWELRVLSREVLSQSTMMDRMVDNQIVPKSRLFRAVVGEIMQLPAEHPAVSRSIVNIMGPCVLLLIASRSVQKKALPYLDLNPETLTNHMVTFALAGLDAVARETKKSPGSG
jgi:TetR/AcrR family transcriptional regulator, regulator of cefoperazone and chloramphenicol sensitivity